MVAEPLHRRPRNRPQQPVGGQLVEPQLQQRLVPPAGEHRDDQPPADLHAALLDPRDAGQELPRGGERVLGDFGRGRRRRGPRPALHELGSRGGAQPAALVARAARAVGLLAEVGQDPPAAAALRPGEADHGVQLAALHGGPLLEGLEVDGQAVGVQVGLEHPRPAAAIGGGVLAGGLFFDLGQGVGERSGAVAQRAGELVAVEVRRGVGGVLGHLQQRRQHRPHRPGLEPGEHLAGLGRLEEPQRGQFHLGAFPQDDVGVFEQPQAGLHRHAVLGGADVLGDPLGRRRHRRRLPAEVFVDLGDGLALGVGALDEELLDVTVALAEEHDAARGVAVAPGPAGLLVVRLDAARAVVVDHRPHVGLVHAHAEGVGGDGDPRPAAHEGPLGLLAGLGIQSAVVDHERHAGLVQQGPDVLDGLLGGDVDDPRPRALRIGQADLHEQLLEDLALLALVAAADDLVGEVRPVEPGDHRERVGQGEFPADVAPHLGGGGGGEGQGRRPAEAVAGLLQPAVVGPEVVPPLADAVGLVHREQPYPHGGHGGVEPAVAEALGGDEDELVAAGLDRADAFVLLVGVQAAVDEGRRQPAGFEAADLVGHQGDQRGHHQRDALAEHGRQLVAERLAAARGHDAQGVAAGEHGVDDLALPGAEPRQAEVPTELGEQKILGCGRGGAHIVRV